MLNASVTRELSVINVYIFSKGFDYIKTKLYMNTRIELTRTYNHILVISHSYVFHKNHLSVSYLKGKSM